MMWPTEITDEDLRAWFEEALPAERMSAIEVRLRTDPLLQQRAAAILQSRETTGPTIGDIWRQHRLSCPQRELWGSWLLGVVEPALAEYLQFHLEVIGCRYCQANLEDLRQAQTSSQQGAMRRQKIHESSAGHLRKLRDSQ